MKTEQIFIALLRGINVGGAKPVKMDILKKLCAKLGLVNAQTYVQSGNIVFGSGETDSGRLEKMLEKSVREKFGFDVPVVVRSADELAKIAQGNPFLKDKAVELDKLHVTFLSEVPKKETTQSLSMPKAPSEKYEVVGREVYLYCPEGYGRTKLTNNAFEAKLKVKATTRNWNTVNKLLEMAKKN